MTLRILVVEDDYPFRDTLLDILNLEGFAASGVGTISAYRAWRQTHSCDILIVDRNLPDGDGIEVINTHRQTESGPVIIISCNGLVDDRIQGIEADADYYLVKPIVTNELVSLLRRLDRKRLSVAAVNSAWMFHAVNWRLCDPAGESVVLNKNERAFIACFIERPGFIIDRDTIIDALGGGPDSFDTRRLDTLVRRLRLKLKAAGMAALPVATVYGSGYVFNAQLSEQ